MRVRRITDVAAEWLAVEQAGGDSVVGLQLRADSGESYETVAERVAKAVTKENPWGCRPWELFMASEEDSPSHQAVGFWRQHGEKLGATPEAIEASDAANGWIRRVAARPIDGITEFLKVFNDPWRIRFQRATLIPSSDDQVGRLLDKLVVIPAGRGYEYSGGVVAVASAEHCCVLLTEETDRHEPCLGLYGDISEIDLIQPAFDAVG